MPKTKPPRSRKRSKKKLPLGKRVVNQVGSWLQSLWRAAYDTVMHDGIEHAGYLAFLSILSLFPFLVLLMTLAGMVGELEIGQQFTEILLAHLPYDVTVALKPRIEEIVSGPPPGLLTVALLGALWTASSAVEGLRTILNRAYRVSTPPSYPLRRLMSLVQLVVLVALVGLAMMGIVVMPIVMKTLSQYIHVDYLIDSNADRWRFWGGAVVMFLSVASIYYILPNTRQKFRTTFPGAAVAVGLWTGVAMLFSYYLSQFDQVSFIYGSLGSVIAALFFFYLVAMILIFGAELNYHLERAQGHKIVEKEKVLDAANHP